jgi:selenocysteine-specific elongation factor
VILGTAGHIDHGKTSLVRALTGVDTDRLPEEKKRGITIELGFAPLVLDGAGTIGVVDVPGHEAFVRTMVAGATGIDLALVVIAADEGVMPQTREHLAILELLGVQQGVIALTKCDLVDEEWLALVEEEARVACARALPTASVVRTSVTSGQGIPELRTAIADAARAIAPRAETDLFRLPVDRVFTIKGTGTVVTGTVWSGRVARDEVARILPGETTARVRGIQGHGSQLDAARPGARCAVALAGVEVADVPRGSTIVTDPQWRTSTRARVEIRLVPEVEIELRPRTWFRLHIGTSEVGARIVTREVDLDAPFAARLVLDAPVLLRAGDRFVLRSSRPLNTIGGGIVIDPYAPARARMWPVGLSAGERLAMLVEEAGSGGLSVVDLPVRLGAAPSEVARILGERSDVVAVGDRLVLGAMLDDSSARLIEVLKNYHVDHPLEPGAPINAVRDRVGGSAAVADAAVERSMASGVVVRTAGVLHLPDWSVSLSSATAQLAEAVLNRLEAAGAEPPGADELSAAIGGDIGGILRYLDRRGQIVQVEPNRYYTAGQLKSLIDRLRATMAGRGEVSPAEIRDALALSRKYLIPFLEYCDRAGYTIRNPNGRTWNGT